jgi:hypothetical protein
MENNAPVPQTAFARVNQSERWNSRIQGEPVGKMELSNHGKGLMQFICRHGGQNLTLCLTAQESRGAKNIFGDVGFQSAL